MLSSFHIQAWKQHAGIWFHWWLFSTIGGIIGSTITGGVVMLLYLLVGLWLGLLEQWLGLVDQQLDTASAP